MDRPRRYLFVCAANLNRSPTAEDVFRTLAAQAGVEVEVRSRRHHAKRALKAILEREESSHE
jgi:protein-tyrosine-phosphatase